MKKVENSVTRSSSSVASKSPYIFEAKSKKGSTKKRESGIYGDQIMRSNFFVDHALDGDEPFDFVPESDAVLSWEDVHVLGQIIDNSLKTSNVVGTGSSVGISGQLIQQDTMKILYESIVPMNPGDHYNKTGDYIEESKRADRLVKVWLNNVKNEFSECFEGHRSLHPTIAEKFDSAQVTSYYGGVYGKKNYQYTKVYIVVFN